MVTLKDFMSGYKHSFPPLSRVRRKYELALKQAAQWKTEAPLVRTQHTCLKFPWGSPLLHARIRIISFLSTFSKQKGGQLYDSNVKKTHLHDSSFDCRREMG